MDNPLNKDRSYCCNDCNKTYSSYKSLWNHNNKFHTPDGTVKYEESTIKYEESTKKYEDGTIKSDDVKKYNCKYCLKIYDKKSSKWSH